MSVRFYCLLLIVILFSIEIEGKSLLKGTLSNRINYLLNLTESEKKYNTILESYISTDPTLSIYKSEIKSFLNQFLSFELLRSHIIKIYGDLYTLSDINGMIKFYSSTLGKKLIEKESQAEVRLIQLIQNQLQKQMPQIMLWFQRALNKDYSNNETSFGIK